MGLIIELSPPISQPPRNGVPPMAFAVACAPTPLIPITTAVARSASKRNAAALPMPCAAPLTRPRGCRIYALAILFDYIWWGNFRRGDRRRVVDLLI